MPDKLDMQQAKWHLDKATHLEHEWENRKTAGERRILKMEHELRQELERIQNQIDAHKTKAGLIN